MKHHLFIYLLSVWMLMGVAFPAHSECEIDIAVLTSNQSEDVPASSQDYLVSRLRQLVTQNRTTSFDDASRFFVTGRFDHILYNNLPGPPIQTSLHTYLTLTLGDAEAKKIFSAITLEVRGVGISPERAFINALRIISPDNSKIKEFLATGERKIITYYDSHFTEIIAKAEHDASLHNYDEALWRLSMIPFCCSGYEKASKMMVPILKKYLDREGTRLLDLAESCWAKSPDVSGADEAYRYLMQIDPTSQAYAEAKRLEQEIKQSIKDDKFFETREKYRDQVQTERLSINAAREIGTAYGRNQKQTTNLYWLK